MVSDRGPFSSDDLDSDQDADDMKFDMKSGNRISLEHDLWSLHRIMKRLEQEISSKDFLEEDRDDLNDIQDRLASLIQRIDGE